jgi:hypothetical protein
VKVRFTLFVLCIVTAATGLAWQAWDMFSPARRPMLQGWDDSYYYFWLPSVIIDHDLDFTNQLRQSGTLEPGRSEQALAEPRTSTGLVTNKYPPGWALGSLPFFLVAHLFAPPHATGFEPVYLVAVWLGQLLYAVVGLWLAIRILARTFALPLAMTAALVVWLASPLVYYQTARLSMSHSQVFALAMAVFLLALKIADGERRWPGWAAFGFCAALLVVTRNLCVVYLIAPLWLVLPRTRTLRHAAALGLGAALPLAVQVAAWRLLYGSWVAYSYGGERFDFGHLHLRAILFSARHGWFYWHPLLLAGIGGFAWWAWRRPEGRGWLASLLLVVLLNAAWPMWWLGSSFGHRGFEVATFFAMAGLAAVLSVLVDKPRWRTAFGVTCGVAIAWNLALFGLFLTQRIPREEPVTYADAARALVRAVGPAP